MSTVVVVGAGPGAVSLVERLVANHEPGTPLTLHLVDPHPSGSGRIWRAEQSPLMRMNSMAADVTMFTDDSATIEGPIRPGPALSQWVGEVGADELRDPALLPLIRSVTPTTFPERQVQGEYLGWVLRQAVADGAPDVTVHTHAATVDEVTDGPPHIVVLDNGSTIEADVVVLAVGHLDGEPVPPELPEAGGRRHVLPAYSADVEWLSLRAGENVIVRGLGLAFVDIALLLTEGRGGWFTDRVEGGFDYHPCGAEPVLWAGSRRGIPHHSKTGYPLQGPPPPLPAVFTPDVVAALVARGDLDFRADVWPWIAAELRFAHHHELFLAHPDRVATPWSEAEALLRRVDAATGLPVDDGAIDALVLDPVDRLDLEALDHPMRGVVFDDLSSVQRFVTDGQEADVARRRNPRFSADLGAFLGLLTSYGQVMRLVQVGAFAPESLVGDVDNWWKGWFSHLASGPPPDRAQQLAALARAGVIRYVGVLGDVRPDGHGWVADTPSVPGAQVRGSVLVEARLPKPHVAHTPGTLLSGLLHQGAISEEILQSPGGRPPVGTGLIRIDLQGHALRADGSTHPSLFAIGALTDVRTPAAFSRPRTDAPTFRLADAVARAVLARLADAEVEAAAAEAEAAEAPLSAAS